LAADLYSVYAAQVVGRLHRRFPEEDLQVCWDACTSAVLHVASHYDKFDPTRSSLVTFLTAVANRRLLTLRRAERRRRKREQEKSAQAVTNHPAAANSPLQELADRELAETVKAEVAQTLEEQLALDLWLLNADYPAYAQKLELSNLPEDEGQVYVERLLARLRQRLHRFRKRLSREGEAP
jgi:DNA-directed RNA polymerase specialized sigma24 family protein